MFDLESLKADALNGGGLVAKMAHALTEAEVGNLEPMVKSGLFNTDLQRAGVSLSKAEGVNYPLQGVPFGSQDLPQGQFAPLVPQSIDNVLTSITFSDKHLKLFKMLPRKSWGSTVYEYAQIVTNGYRPQGHPRGQVGGRVGGGHEEGEGQHRSHPPRLAATAVSATPSGSPPDRASGTGMRRMCQLSQPPPQYTSDDGQPPCRDSWLNGSHCISVAMSIAVCRCVTSGVCPPPRPHPIGLTRPSEVSRRRCSSTMFPPL